MTTEATTAPDEQQQPRWIEYMRLDVLNRSSASRNAKHHDDEAMRVSITRFGFADGPILDERTGRLVAGHGRIEDLQWRYESGSKPPDGIRVADDGMWEVPVQRGWASESDAEAEGFLIGHNHVGERGGWDERALATTLSDLNAEDPGLLFATAFSEGDLDRFLAKFAEPDEGDTTERPERDDDDEDDDEADPPALPDPEHTQWYTVVIREVAGTTRAAWLAHVDTFNGDEAAALENLLGVSITASESIEERGARLLREGAGVYVGRDAADERPGD